MQEVIEKYAEMYDIPQKLLEAIIETESANNKWAIRYEDHYRWLFRPNYYASQNIISLDTEKEAQKTSWGLMQIMGAVARERGFDGAYLSELCKPEVGIKYGSKHLKMHYKKYDNWKDAVASYNAGSPRHKDNGDYVNQRYVDKVFEKAGDIDGA